MPSMLALFPGVLIIVPPLVSYWNGTKRVQAAAIEGGTAPVNGWIALVLYIVQPKYMVVLFQTGIGIMAVIASAVLACFGFWWLRTLMRIEV